MSENTRNVVRSSLAFLLALITVIGGGSFMKDAQLKADEQAPEMIVVVEEPSVIEVIVPSVEPVIVVQEIRLPTDEAIGDAEAAEEAAVMAEEAAAEDSGDAGMTVSVIEDPDVPLAPFEETRGVGVIPVVSILLVFITVLWHTRRRRKYEEEIRRLKHELLSEAMGK